MDGNTSFLNLPRISWGLLLDLSLTPTIIYLFSVIADITFIIKLHYLVKEVGFINFIV